ncbi:MAG: type II secretion system protein [Candidatus Gastranaerophilaceae bacterium]
MKRSAFTLREVLLVILIVGIISVLSLQTLQAQKTKFAFSCYHFYRDLKIAVGHMAAATYGGSLNSFSCESALDKDEDGTAYKACVAAGISAVGGGGNADILDYRLGNNFCIGLSQYLGTASTIACSAGNLNNATLTNIYGNIGSGMAPSFKLMNKYLVYVSDRVAGSSTHGTYRIISVDFNGSSNPNKTGVDIISFAIFDNGEVLPLGIAADSNNYFSAVIKVRNILPMPASKKDDVLRALRHPAAIIFSSDKKPLTFRQAYCDVYGSSDNYADFCNGISFDENFTYGGHSMPVTYCTNNKYNDDGTVAQKLNGQDIVPECEFTVIKPQVSKLIPVSQDTYSSKGNVDDVNEQDGTANQIYKY